MRRALAPTLAAAAVAFCLTSLASGADDTPSGGGLHLRLTPLTRGVLPNSRFVARFSVNYSGPGRSGDIFLTFVADDSHGRKLKARLTAPGLRVRHSYSPGATSMLVNGVSSARTRFVRATFMLRADGKICVRNARAWLVENPADFHARLSGFCNYRS